MATAMVWGAGGGIGQAMVNALSAADWEVVALHHRPPSTPTAAQQQLEVDVASAYGVEVAVRQAAAIADSVDLWIYTVGDIAAANIADMAPETWQRLINVNLTGAFLATHYSLPLLAENAHLIFVGAISERLRLPGLSAYGAAKSALEAYVEALRKEERRRRVTLLRPAAVDTPFWEKVPLRLPKNALPPAQVAERILTIYREQEQGTIDLV